LVEPIDPEVAMKRWFLVTLALSTACGAPSPELGQLGQASDAVNACRDHTLPTSLFTLPDADAPFQSRFPDNDLDEWFWIGHVRGLQTGKRYGLETFLFRFSAFGQSYRWGQVAITDPSTGKFHQGQYLVPGLYSETVDGFDLDLGGVAGAPRATGGGGILDHVTASTFDGSGFDLRFTNLSNPMVQFNGGHAAYVDPLSGVRVGENYYYSRPAMVTGGSITVDGVTEEVAGLGWFDREWRACCFGGYFHNPPVFTQWDWAAIHLSDGSSWSYYDIYTQGHPEATMSRTANFLERPPGCEQGVLTGTDFTLERIGAWTSPHTQKTYPAAFRFQVPSKELDLTLVPVVQDQEATEVPLALGFQPWYEGWASVSGTRHGRPVSGEGWIELFGYPTP
jgi:hypothetical protein